MNEIVPTILTSDLNDYFSRLNLLKNICNRVQVDIIDGKFAPNRTITLESLKNFETSLKIDLHLMVNEPEEWVDRALELLPDRLIGQVEMMVEPWSFINQAVEAGMQAGLALDIETPVESISDEVYHLADLILILSVKAGFSGQVFDSRALDKIEKVKKIVGDLGKIAVDGGLNEKNIRLCKKAGASIFYVGNDFWEREDLRKSFDELTKVAS